MYYPKEQYQASVQERLSSIYIVKAICALLVINIHTYGGIVGQLLRPISEIAVPMFYMITGYFLSTTLSCEKLAKMIKKTAIILAVLDILYIIVGIIFTNYPFPWEMPELYIRNLFLEGYPPAGVHLWYLTALLGSLLILYICMSFRLTPITIERGAITLGLVVAFIPSISTYFDFGLGLGGMIFSTLFRSLPFISLGLFIRRRSLSLKKLNIWILYLVFSVGVLMMYLPDSINAPSHLIGKWLVITSIMIVALRYPTWGKGTWMKSLGQKYSASIYYWHMVPIQAMGLLSDHPLIPLRTDFTLAVSIASALILSWLVVWIQERMNWSVLR